MIITAEWKLQIINAFRHLLSNYKIIRSPHFYFYKCSLVRGSEMGRLLWREEEQLSMYKTCDLVGGCMCMHVMISGVTYKVCVWKRDVGRLCSQGGAGGGWGAFGERPLCVSGKLHQAGGAVPLRHHIHARRPGQEAVRRAGELRAGKKWGYVKWGFKKQTKQNISAHLSRC